MLHDVNVKADFFFVQTKR